MALTAEAAIERFTLLIHREARGCARRLPARSSYTHDDLYQEGALLLIQVAPKLDETRSKAITFFTACLRNRYVHLVHREWKRSGLGPGREDPERALRRVRVEPEQGAYLDMLASLPDRYRRLLPPIPPAEMS